MPADPLGRITVAALKIYIDKQLSTDDALLDGLLASAIATVGERPPHGCGRLLFPDPAFTGAPLADTAPDVTRTLDVWRRAARVPDARSISAVTINGALLVEDTDYTVTRDRDLIVRLRLASRWQTARSVAVTGRFGMVDIPALLADGIYILAARWFHERDAQYADGIVVGDAGSPAFYRRLPQRTQHAIQTFTTPVDAVLAA